MIRFDLTVEFDPLHHPSNLDEILMQDIGSLWVELKTNFISMRFPPLI